MNGDQHGIDEIAAFMSKGPISGSTGKYQKIFNIFVIKLRGIGSFSVFSFTGIKFLICFLKKFTEALTY